MGGWEVLGSLKNHSSLQGREGRGGARQGRERWDGTERGEGAGRDGGGGWVAYIHTHCH